MRGGQVLDYIDTINQASCAANGNPFNPITAKIKATMPIMVVRQSVSCCVLMLQWLQDAFGNATMPRNDDSSR